MTNYSHKPPAIKDVIKFIKGIPAKDFCDRALTRGTQHCILGHLCLAYGKSDDDIESWTNLDKPITDWPAVIDVNNASPKGIKTRLLRHFKQLQKGTPRADAA